MHAPFCINRIHCAIPAHSPLQTKLQMNYRLDAESGFDPETSLTRLCPVELLQHPCDNPLTPPAAQCYLSHWRVTSRYTWKYVSSRWRQGSKISNSIPHPRLRRYSVRSPIGRRLSALPALTASTPRCIVALSFLMRTRLASPHLVTHLSGPTSTGFHVAILLLLESYATSCVGFIVSLLELSCDAYNFTNHIIIAVNPYITFRSFNLKHIPRINMDLLVIANFTSQLFDK